MFRSEDKGETWTKMNSLNPRPMYFSQIRIDPNEPQRIYVNGVNLHISDDGGKTFRDDGALGVHSGSSRVVDQSRATRGTSSTATTAACGSATIAR